MVPAFAGSNPAAPAKNSDKPAWSKPSSLRLTRVDHIALNVANAEASAERYRERFGFTVLHGWAGPTILMIGKGNIRMGLFEKKGAKPVAQPVRHKIIQHFGFSVDADRFQRSSRAKRATARGHL